MAERIRSFSERDFELSDKYIESLSRFREGILNYRLPERPTEKSNFRRLCKKGVIDIFAEQSQYIADPRLEMYFTDDFSKICLRKRTSENEVQESLVSVGLYEKTISNNGKKRAREQYFELKVKNEIRYLPVNDISRGVLRNSIVGNIVLVDFESSEPINN